MTELSKRYDGRVLAFDHRSVTLSPSQNAQHLLAQIDSGCTGGNTVTTDIICHSRGGLVARLLAGELDSIPTDDIHVRRIVFIGVPNEGTPLGIPDSWIPLAERVLTAFNRQPTTHFEDCLAGASLALRLASLAYQRVDAAVDAAPGLTALDPAGDFIAEMNSGARIDATYYAITSDYEPPEANWRVVGWWLNRRKDRRADEQLFGGVRNDLVVPTDGVYLVRSDPMFEDHLVGRSLVYTARQSSPVKHTEYFAQPETAAKILDWLKVEQNDLTDSEEASGVNIHTAT